MRKTKQAGLTMIEVALIIIIASIALISSLWLMDAISQQKKFEQKVIDDSQYLNQLLTAAGVYCLDNPDQCDKVRTVISVTNVVGNSSTMWSRKLHLFNISQSGFIVKNSADTHFNSVYLKQTPDPNLKVYFYAQVKQKYLSSIKYICGVIPDCEEVSNDEIIIAKSSIS
ncbi:MAG: hypothetical protein ACRY3E_00010, partial [Candidatus Lariskella arthropodorum]